MVNYKTLLLKGSSGDYDSVKIRQIVTGPTYELLFSFTVIPYVTGL